MTGGTCNALPQLWSGSMESQTNDLACNKFIPVHTCASNACSILDVKSVSRRARQYSCLSNQGHSWGHCDEMPAGNMIMSRLQSRLLRYSSIYLQALEPLQALQISLNFKSRLTINLAFEDCKDGKSCLHEIAVGTICRS